MKKCLVIASVLLNLLLVLPTAYSQSEVDDDGGMSSADSDSDSVISEDFTGTLADDDPDNDALKEEEEAFGSDDSDTSADAIEDTDNEGGQEDSETKAPDQEAVESEEGLPYLLKFEFNSQVIFTNLATGEPYIEIDYVTKIEQPVAMIEKRYRTKGEAQFESNTVGLLAGNDLFTCKLDIIIESTPVELMTRLTRIEETDDSPETSEAAIQIKFEDTYKEDWFSNCTGIDGSIFNTQGDPEKYNRFALDNILPSLNAVVVEDYDPYDDKEIELTLEPLQILDEEVNENILITGSGTLTIEYAGY